MSGDTDGMRLDVEGNIWCGMGNGDPAEDGVHCYAPNGDLIGKIHLPETCANLCFRRKEKEPPVHGREHIGLFAVRGHRRRDGAVTSRNVIPGVHREAMRGKGIHQARGRVPKESFRRVDTQRMDSLPVVPSALAGNDR